MTKKEATATMKILESLIFFKKNYSNNFPCYEMEKVGNNYEMTIRFPFQDELTITSILLSRFSTLSTTIEDNYTLKIS